MSDKFDMGSPRTSIETQVVVVISRVNQSTRRPVGKLMGLAVLQAIRPHRSFLARRLVRPAEFI
jgi:hypothetical protein